MSKTVSFTDLDIPIDRLRQTVPHMQHVIPKEATKQPMVANGIAVSEGDTVDFIVDPNAHPSFDSFRWVPEIRNANVDGENWNYSAQFSGPADLADAWETYAQALLGTNEFLFVD